MKKNELKDLAEQIEVWMAESRYANSNINKNISFESIHDFRNNFNLILMNPFIKARRAILLFKINCSKMNVLGFETPPHICNRILMSEAFVGKEEDEI